MIEIDENKLIGKGSARSAYLHPSDPTKVLKVYQPGKSPERTRKRKWLRRLASETRFDANRRDLIEHSKYRIRDLSLHSNICQVFGYVDTNLGIAIIVENVMNDDGRTSQTLTEHYKSGMAEDLVKQVHTLFKKLADNHVVVRDLNANNIMVRRKGSNTELVIIDGLGDANVIKYATWSMSLNRKKLERKLQRLLATMKKMKQKAKTKSVKA